MCSLIDLSMHSEYSWAGQMRLKRGRKLRNIVWTSHCSVLPIKKIKQENNTKNICSTRVPNISRSIWWANRGNCAYKFLNSIWCNNRFVIWRVEDDVDRLQLLLSMMCISIFGHTHTHTALPKVSQKSAAAFVDDEWLSAARGSNLLRHYLTFLQLRCIIFEAILCGRNRTDKLI